MLLMLDLFLLSFQNYYIYRIDERHPLEYVMPVTSVPASLHDLALGLGTSSRAKKTKVWMFFQPFRRISYILES